MRTPHCIQEIFNLKHHLLLGITSLFLLLSPHVVWGQDDSNHDILISDLNYSRFLLFLRPTSSFISHPKSKSWQALLEKNLCWSGTFKLYQSQNNYCRSHSDGVDMQLALEINKHGAFPSLRLVVADTKGTVLFWKTIKLIQNKLQEQAVMEVVNEITEQLTGISGVLGSTIAFTLKQPGYKKVIARSNTHGQNLAVVSRNGFPNISPKFNLDGTRILYTRLGSQQSVIYDDLEGGAIALTKAEMKSSGGTWSRDGKHVVMTLNINKNADLYEQNLQTNTLVRLTRHSGIDTAPSISPDGEYILFVSDRIGPNSQIHMMHHQSKQIFRWSFSGSRNTDPVYSPDGSLVAFTKTLNHRDQIYVMDIFGENERALTKGRYHSEQPAWSPDGKQLIFTSNRSGDYKLYTLFLDGEGLRRVTNTPPGFEEKEPTWTQRQLP